MSKNRLRTIKPGFKDHDGYWHDPRTNCCNAGVVYYRQDARQYVRWHGYEGDLPGGATCNVCGWPVTLAKSEANPDNEKGE